MSTAHTLPEIDYPESDGRPMGETDLHRLWMIRIYDLLSWRYRGQRVYIGSDLLVYFTEGRPKDFVVPDNFVVLDCDPGPRRTFKIWEEGRSPDVVWEVTSRSTRRKDMGFKTQTYARLGVQELFLFDPTADYLRPPLQGFRFVEGQSEPIAPAADGALECRPLGLSLRLESAGLAMFDAATGERLLTEAEAERAERRTAEEEVRRLREQLTRLQPPGT
jgi:Uma2 family endonuclease